MRIVPNGSPAGCSDGGESGGTFGTDDGSEAGSEAGSEDDADDADDAGAWKYEYKKPHVSHNVPSNKSGEVSEDDTKR